MKDRKAITKRIEHLLRNHCDICEIRRDYADSEKRWGNAPLSKHCNKVCTIGKQLQACGRELAEVTA